MMGMGMRMMKKIRRIMKKMMTKKIKTRMMKYIMMRMVMKKKTRLMKKMRCEDDE
jgi:hypothetical protein